MREDYDYLFKVMLGGEWGAGKTSLLLRWVDDIFNESHISTIGFDFKIKSYTVKNKRVKLQLWDTVGQERFRDVGQVYEFLPRGSGAVLLCADAVCIIKDSDYLDKEMKIHLEYIIDRYSYGDTDRIIYLVINKMDLVEESTKKQLCARVNEFAEQYKIASTNIFLTSAKTGEGVRALEDKIIMELLKRYDDGDEILKRALEDMDKEDKPFRLEAPSPQKSSCCNISFYSPSSPVTQSKDESERSHLIKKSINADDDLEQGLSHNSFSFGKSAKKKKAPSKNERRSEMDPRMHVTQDGWVVSLARKTEEGNTKHVFLIVEGINAFGKPIVRRYELGYHNTRENFAVIRILPTDEAETNVKTVMQLTKGAKCSCLRWNITKKQAKLLHQNVLKDQQLADDPEKGIRYLYFGKESMIGKSTQKEGHSCFTWAREKLRELNDKKINEDLASKKTDWIAADPSLYLESEEEKQTCCGYCGAICCCVFSCGKFSL